MHLMQIKHRSIHFVSTSLASSIFLKCLISEIPSVSPVPLAKINTYTTEVGVMKTLTAFMWQNWTSRPNKILFPLNNLLQSLKKRENWRMDLEAHHLYLLLAPICPSLRLYAFRVKSPVETNKLRNVHTA